MAFLNKEQLAELGFKNLGDNVLISDKASFYGINRIEIGDNSRIDDFCILSAGIGGIKIGKNVHVACFSSLIGKDQITLEDFANISSRVSFYSSNDDYSGDFLTGPTIPEKYRSYTNSPITIGRHVIIGSGTVILPGVVIGGYSSVGALSLVRKSIPEFEIHAGVPAKFIKERGRKMLELEKSYLSEGGR
jgi:acetyltransferase-like isoleucine patch superfamily enzyme